MKKFSKVFFHPLWLQLKRAIFKVKYHADIDVTDNCNLRCKHCYHFHCKNDFKAQELPLHVWKKRFNGLYKSGIRNILLCGGEPALRIDVIMAADKIFPYVFVITNGTIKIPKKFNHTLFVSIDGSQKTNDSIRGKSVFSRVMKNYLGDERVVINMTLTPYNYRDLEYVVKLSQENGFQGVVCNICAGDTDFGTPQVVTRKERVPIIRELKRVMKLYPKDFLLNKRMIEWFEYPDHRDSCAWRDEVLHFDVSWNLRKCFVTNPDCSNCGSFAGAFQSLASLRHPIEMMKLFLP
ncbi:MAG: 4Fe-4S cluster-binding domain-containing protein [Candidatus Bathyarchaeum sp.]|nr:MAG: 4Fe-4S cluster-binding domain-containing protein [Candidatus Bathyarchaeum sp.]